VTLSSHIKSAVDHIVGSLLDCHHICWDVMSSITESDRVVVGWI